MLEHTGVWMNSSNANVGGTIHLEAGVKHDTPDGVKLGEVWQKILTGSPNEVCSRREQEFVYGLVLEDANSNKTVRSGSSRTGPTPIRIHREP